MLQPNYGFITELQDMLGHLEETAALPAGPSEAEQVIAYAVKKAFKLWDAKKTIFYLDDDYFKKLAAENLSPVVEHGVMSNLPAACPMVILPEDAPELLGFPAVAFWTFIDQDILPDEHRLVILSQIMDLENFDFSYIPFTFDFDPYIMARSHQALFAENVAKNEILDSAKHFLHVALRSTIRMCLPQQAAETARISKNISIKLLK